MAEFRRFAGLMLVALALVAVPAAGQETTGSISGTVTDTDGAALPGVTVTLENTGTGQVLVATTGGDGKFQFVRMSVGAYDVKAELDGFQTVSRENVRVTLGGNADIDFEMPVGAIEDVIVVTTEAPLINTRSTTGGVVVSTEEFSERVPLSRDVAQVALLAPGTTSGDTAFDSSARAYTPGQSVSAIGGSSVGENTYLLNGLNITNFRNGIGGSNVPFEFVQEAQVKTGGYAAEYGRSTGGVLNFVSKQGSNDFGGAVSVFFNPESLQEQSPNYVFGFNQEESFESMEANASLGGPIAKDRAFFFAMVQFNDVESLGVGTDRQTLRVRDDPYYGAKLDFNVTPSHRLEGTYFTDAVTVESTETNIDLASRARTGTVGGGTHEAGGDNIIGKYTGIFGSNFVASAQFGKNQFDRTILSSADANPWCYDSRDGGLTPCGQFVNALIGVADDEREAFRVDFDFFAGDHAFRAGLDDETNTSNDLTTYSGGEYFRFFPAGSRGSTSGTFTVRHRIFIGGGTFETLSNAYYLQDQWQVNDKVLLNLGVRNESFDNKNALGESFIKIDDQWAPRIGAIADLRGDGTRKLYANYGVYHLYIASNTNIRLAGAETFTEDWYDMLPTCDINNPSQDSCLGTVLQMNVFGDGSVPDVRTTKSTNIDPMFTDEIVVGYDQAVGDNWSLGGRLIQRTIGEIIEDITIDAGLGIQGAFEYRLVNPNTDFDGFFDPDHDGENLIPVSFTAAELGYPEPDREYTAAEFTFQRRFVDNFTLQGSVTLSESKGNYEGYVRSDNGQDDAGITTLYDFAGLLDGAFGDLPNDRPLNAKIYGAYQFDNGILVGGNVSYRDGRPINAFGVHPTDPFAALYGAESFFDQGSLVPRGTRGRTDDVFNVDMQARKDFDLGRTSLALSIDVFNLFDESTVTEIVETADDEGGAPDPNYLEAVRFQSPRRVRFGVRLRY